MSQWPVVVALFTDGQTHVTGFACDASLSVIEVVSLTPFFIHVRHLFPNGR